LDPVPGQHDVFFTPEALMVDARFVIVLPVIVLFLLQRFFIQDRIVGQI